MNLQRSHKVALLSAAITTLSVALAAALAYQVELRDQRHGAEQLAAQILYRNERITDQVYRGIGDLQAAEFGRPCAAESRAMMTKIALRSSLLQAVVHVNANRITCGSLDLAGVDIGPLDFVARNGYLIRASRKLPIDAAATYRISQSPAGYAAIVQTDLALDMIPAALDAHGAIISALTGDPISSTETWSVAWLKNLRPAAKASFVREGYVVAVEPSRKYDYYAVAAFPVEQLQVAWASSLWLAIPAGLVTGGALSLALAMALRRSTGLPAMLRQALRSKSEMYLQYQPFVDLKTGKWTGAEALMRWRRPDGEFISPALFIPVAEQQGMISEVTAKVLEILRRDMDQVLPKHPDFFVSINLAPTDLLDDGFPVRLGALLAGWKIHHLQLRLEVTEHSLIDAKAASEAIARLKAMGLRIALDDFGTGYSSLSCVAEMDIDSIKIDKAFVDVVGTDSLSAQMADHIIQIGKSLRKRLVAEGIETEAQASYMRERGVEFGQGWFFAKAMSAREIDLQLANQRGDTPTP